MVTPRSVPGDTVFFVVVGWHPLAPGCNQWRLPINQEPSPDCAAGTDDHQPGRRHATHAQAPQHRAAALSLGQEERANDPEAHESLVAEFEFGSAVGFVMVAQSGVGLSIGQTGDVEPSSVMQPLRILGAGAPRSVMKT